MISEQVREWQMSQPPHDEDERLRLLGAIVDAHSALELRSQVILAGFVSDPRVGMALAADLNFSTLIIKLKVLSTIPELGHAGDRLREWSNAAQQAGERRNAVVHSMWAAKDPDDPESGVQIKLSARGKRTDIDGIVHSTPASNPELDELLTELLRVYSDGEQLASLLRDTDKWSDTDK